jgi:4-amino-4-deoxy-L-arabinose transferase-like glycosyltransferase
MQACSGPQQWQRWAVIALVVLWAVLYLPHLRSNPNWYGDEGEWMEKSWTFIHGTPRVGPVSNDFVFPYPYPPLYMLVNGALLRVFGNDIVVGRALGAVTALAVAGLLLWIGVRLRGFRFGLLCALAFLVYPEAVINFRWVRSHPMAGALGLACIGFLIAYLQERRLRHLWWAGLMCSLATATNYYAVGLIPTVIAAAAWVAWPRWREPRAWRDVALAAALAGAYGTLFVLWYITTQGGVGHLHEQMRRLAAMTTEPAGPVATLARIVKFCFATPVFNPRGERIFVDLWLVLAAAGVAVFPLKRWRGWLAFWLVLLMWPVFRKQDNVSFFFYPATMFLPVMALGVAGALDRAGQLAGRLWKPSRHAPAAVVLGVLALASLNGSTGHFRTKIDLFTQQFFSVETAEQAMQFVNQNTSGEDFVLVPKQLYWLVRDARKSMLSHCVTCEGGTNAAWPVPIPREMFWFDCSWTNAKFVVLASGVDLRGRPMGIDAVYTRGLEGVPEIVNAMLEQHWPVVWHSGEQYVLAPLGDGKNWPVALGGEYLVLANPRFVTGALPEAMPNE